MQVETKYSSAFNVINGTSQNPVSNTETAIINVFGPLTSTANNPDNQSEFIRGNTQASLGWNYTAGSTTKIDFRIYYYRYEVNANANPYQATATWQTTSSGTFTVYPWLIEVLAAQAGRLSFDFQIPACDGIKITVQSTGTTTSSTLTEVHLGLRTN